MYIQHAFAVSRCFGLISVGTKIFSVSFSWRSVFIGRPRVFLVNLCLQRLFTYPLRARARAPYVNNVRVNDSILLTPPRRTAYPDTLLDWSDSIPNKLSRDIFVPYLRVARSLRSVEENRLYACNTQEVCVCVTTVFNDL